jgi:hypothetical protein
VRASTLENGDRTFRVVAYGIAPLPRGAVSLCADMPVCSELVAVEISFSKVECAMYRMYILVGLPLILSSLALAEPSTNDFAARNELHSIHTLTLSDTQFLKGDAGGQPTSISGQLRIAQGTGRLPVVVLQHGSGGMGANVVSVRRTSPSSFLSRVRWCAH